MQTWRWIQSNPDARILYNSKNQILELFQYLQSVKHNTILSTITITAIEIPNPLTEFFVNNVKIYGLTFMFKYSVGRAFKYNDFTTDAHR